MQNLLPTVTDALVLTNKRVAKLTTWNVEDADPSKAKVDRKLASQFTVDKVEVTKYRVPPKLRPAPNFVDPHVVESLGPSILDHTEEVEEATINTDNMRIDAGIPVYVKPKVIKPSKFDSFLFAEFLSKMPIKMDLYMQKHKTMKVLSLVPFETTMRLLEGDPKFAKYTGSNAIHVLCSPFPRSTVHMTTRREIKHYSFNKTDRIGLEVEMVDNKLTCTKVIPDTQAAPHSLHLSSAEIVAVNGERVLDLMEFQAAMQKAKQPSVFLGEVPPNDESDCILLTVAAFQGGKSKIDELYLHDFSTQQRVKSLLSNLFSNLGGGGGGDFHSDDESAASAADDTDEGSVPGANDKGNGNNNHHHHHGGGQGHNRDVSFVDLGQSIVASSTINAAAEAAKRAVEGGDGKLYGRNGFKIMSAKLEASDAKREFDIYEAKQLDSKVADGDQDREIDENSDDEAPLNPLGESLRAQSKYFNDYFEDKKSSGHNGSDEKGGDDEGGMIARKKQVARDTEPHVETIKLEATVEIQPEPEVIPVKDDWNPLTKVDLMDDSDEERLPTIFPFTAIVCVPKYLAASICWGMPREYIQFTNFTNNHNPWRLEVFWIDEDGAMILRHEVKCGQMHMELCSVDHVWAVVASPITATPASRGGVREFNSLAAEKGSQELGEGSNSSFVQTLDTMQPQLLIVRPCKMALQDGKCLSMIWTPWLSLSVSHIVHPQTSKLKAGSRHAVIDGNTRVQPNIHIQLFEPTKAKLERIGTKLVHSSSAVGRGIQLEGSTSPQQQYADDFSVGGGSVAGGSVAGGSVGGGSLLGGGTGIVSASSLADDDSFASSQQRSYYSSLRKDVEDFKEAVRQSSLRYQSKTGQVDPNMQAAIAKIKRKPLVSTGTLHKLRKK